METSREDVSLSWRWIFEHLIDMKDIGTPVLREMMTYISNLSHSSSLQRRIALRYLEEAIAGSRIDAQVIPLVTVLLKEAQQSSSFPRSSDYKSLLLRVQVEAVIMHIRGRHRDWQGFSQALDQIFPENAIDSLLLKKRGELMALLQDQSQERKCIEVLETYSLTALRRDLLKCITAEKGHSEHTFLDKLLQDVFNGRYPISAGSVGKPAFEKEESQEDFHSADGPRDSIGSDDETLIIRGRNSNADAEEANETPLKDSAAKDMVRSDVRTGVHRITKKRHLTQGTTEGNRAAKKMSCEHPALRQRDQHGKAVTSLSPIKASGGEGIPEPSSGPATNEKVAEETANDSLHVQFLTLGSDGHEEFCHKCKEGGRLLCCDGCPIAVHRKCLGYDSKSFTEEEWFCPLCAQKRASLAVAKAREEEIAAKRRVLQFMANADKGAYEKQQSIRSKRESEQSNGSKLIPDEKRTSVDSQQDHGKAVFRKSTSTIDSNNKGNNSSREAVKQISASCKEWVDISSKRLRRVFPSSTNFSDMAFEPDVSKGKSVEALKQQGAIGDENLENISKPSAEMHRTTAEGHTNVASSSKAGETNRGDSQMEQMNIEGQIGDGDRHDGDLEEDSEGRKPESPRPKKDRRLYFRGNRIIPGMRRKRLQWTKEEEDTLREGVKRFSHDNCSWGFQWTRILEFGQGKFHPSRTDVDLKDKWRNLCKTTR